MANAIHNGILINKNHIDHELASLITYGTTGMNAITNGKATKNINI
jgi:hypothetical protein